MKTCLLLSHFLSMRTHKDIVCSHTKADFLYQLYIDFVFSSNAWVILYQQFPIGILLDILTNTGFGSQMEQGIPGYKSRMWAFALIEQFMANKQGSRFYNGNRRLSKGARTTLIVIAPSIQKTCIYSMHTYLQTYIQYMHYIHKYMYTCTFACMVRGYVKIHNH